MGDQSMNGQLINSQSMNGSMNGQSISHSMSQSMNGQSMNGQSINERIPSQRINRSDQERMDDKSLDERNDQSIREPINNQSTMERADNQPVPETMPNTPLIESTPAETTMESLLKKPSQSPRQPAGCSRLHSVQILPFLFFVAKHDGLHSQSFISPLHSDNHYKEDSIMNHSNHQQTSHKHTGNTFSSIVIASTNTRCIIRTCDDPCFSSRDSTREYDDLTLTSLPPLRRMRNIKPEVPHQHKEAETLETQLIHQLHLVETVVHIIQGGTAAFHANDAEPRTVHRRVISGISTL